MQISTCHYWRQLTSVGINWCLWTCWRAKTDTSRSVSWYFASRINLLLWSLTDPRLKGTLSACYTELYSQSLLFWGSSWPWKQILKQVRAQTSSGPSCSLWLGSSGWSSAGGTRCYGACSCGLCTRWFSLASSSRLSPWSTGAFWAHGCGTPGFTLSFCVLSRLYLNMRTCDEVNCLFQPLEFWTGWPIRC